MPIQLNQIANLQQQVITQGRQAQWQDVLQSNRQTGSTFVLNQTIGGTQVTLEYEPSYQHAKKVREAALAGIRRVQSHGRVVPDLRVIVTAAQVPNIAFIGDSAGGQTVTIFLGPKAMQNNPKANPSYSNQIKGGMGVQAGRGVPDHVYDYVGSMFDRAKARVEAIMVHELGHVLHEAASTNIFWNLKQDINQVHQPGANLAAQVSHYVVFQQNCLEYVAEVFTGLMFGETYSNAIMTEYANCGGP